MGKRARPASAETRLATPPTLFPDSLPARTRPAGFEPFAESRGIPSPRPLFLSPRDAPLRADHESDQPLPRRACPYGAILEGT